MPAHRKLNGMEWLQNIAALLRGEPEYPYLEKYIALEIQRSADPRRDAAVAVGLSGAAVLALLASAARWVIPAPMISWVFVAAAIAFPLGWLARYNAATSDDEKQSGKTKRAAREFVYELHQWKHRRMLRKKLGAAMGEVLDVAAQYWLRANNALQSEAWKAHQSGETWSNFRVKALNSADVAMAKLLLLARESAAAPTDFLYPNFGAARSIAEEMRALAKETERLADKLRLQAQDGLEAGPADALRNAIAEARALHAAQEELYRTTSRS